jgi:ADP-heptose:LPS heptosyltransferase
VGLRGARARHHARDGALLAVGRIVVLRALGLGDLLTGLPALRGLREAFPEAEIVLLSPRWLEPLVALAGVADEVVEPEQDGRAVPHALPKRLHGADLAVNLHGRGPESTALLAATSPRRVVAWGEGWRAEEHEVRRWCRLLEEHGVPADPARLDLPAPDVPPPAEAVGATLVHPGANAGARRWPAERWREVITALDGAVAVTAGRGEEGAAREVAGAAPVLAGLSLLELAAAVSAARAVICPDTGVAHLATALGTPSVVLFGPVPPSEWGPPPDRPQHVALWAGRRGDPNAGEPDPGLLALTAGDVADALRRLA